MAKIIIKLIRKTLAKLNIEKINQKILNVKIQNSLY